MVESFRVLDEDCSDVADLDDLNTNILTEEWNKVQRLPGAPCADHR